MYANRRNFRVLVEKYDGDVRFKTESGNMAVSCMRNENVQYNSYYRNSPVIVD